MIVDSTANAFPLKHTKRGPTHHEDLFLGLSRWFFHICLCVYPNVNMSYLVGGLEHFIFFHILGTIIPFD